MIWPFKTNTTPMDPRPVQNEEFARCFEQVGDPFGTNDLTRSTSNQSSSESQSKVDWEYLQQCSNVMKHCASMMDNPAQAEAARSAALSVAHGLNGFFRAHGFKLNPDAVATRSTSDTRSACKALGNTLDRLWEKYGSRGLNVSVTYSRGVMGDLGDVLDKINDCANSLSRGGLSVSVGFSL